MPLFCSHHSAESGCCVLQDLNENAFNCHFHKFSKGFINVNALHESLGSSFFVLAFFLLFYRRSARAKACLWFRIECRDEPSDSFCISFLFPFCSVVFSGFCFFSLFCEAFLSRQGVVMRGGARNGRGPRNQRGSQECQFPGMAGGPKTQNKPKTPVFFMGLTSQNPK